MSARLAKIDEAVSDANMRIFLDLLAEAEGVKHGYNTMFGNTRFEDLSAHPAVLKEFTQTDGKKNSTSAAGRYQFTNGTWKGLEKNLGISGMSPLNQDRGAVELIREKGALKDVLAGDFKAAAGKLGSTWVSLPTGTAAQKKRDWNWFDSKVAQLQAAGGSATPADGAMAASAPSPQAATPPATGPVGVPVPEADGAATSSFLAQKNSLMDYYRSLGLPDAAGSVPSTDDLQPDFLSRLPTGTKDDQAAATMPWQDEVNGIAPKQAPLPTLSWNAEALSDTIDDSIEMDKISAVNAMAGRQNALPSLKLPAGLKQAIDKLINQA